jgi:hypothetical protein
MSAELAEAFREHWRNDNLLWVQMSERCVAREVVGKVRAVSVTDTWVDVDEWRLPLEDVTSVTVVAGTDQGEADEGREADVRP